MRATAAIVAFGLVCAVTASCGKPEKARVEPVPVVTGVKTEVVTPSDVPQEYSALGTVRSRTASVLTAKVVGSVVRVRVREGDRVRAGQLLLTIDSRDAKTRLQKAKAGLREAGDALDEVERAIAAAEQGIAAAEANQELAESTFKRYKALADRGSASRQEFDQVQARYRAATAEAKRAVEFRQSLEAKKRQVLAKIDQAKADVANAEIHAGYYEITAPISGVVTAKQVDVGDQAAPGVPLIKVEDAAHYRLEANVEDSQAGKIRRGQAARVRIDALDRDLSGRVVEVVPASDPSSRTYLVKVELPPEKDLRSGLFGQAVFTLGQTKAITVPASAVVFRGQLTGVFVVDSSDVAHLRLITVGRTLDGRLEVLSGLAGGERIVAEGVDRVSDGSRVQQ